MSSSTDFEGGPEKAFLRRNWDLPLIEEHQTSIGRRLRYFGMPGPGIEDLIDWEAEVEHVAAVELLREHSEFEADDKDRLRRLDNSLLQHGVDYQLLRGWVEQVLIYGHDAHKQVPHYRDNTDPSIVRFRYDLVNLDFCGGAGYGMTPSGRPTRIRALQELFRRQQGISFLLLLTINVRDTIDRALTAYLRDLRADVAGPLKGTLDWYADCGKGMKKYRLKTAIPAFIQRAAESECFDVQCLPPIAYAGTNAVMVHFAFRCKPTQAQLHSVSSQRLADIIGLPLLTGTKDSISIAGMQHDGFDWQACHDRLVHVPPAFVQSLQAQAKARMGGKAA